MNASNKPQKLRNNQQFRKVYDQGLRYHTPFFSAFILKTDDDNRRIGITVTRKVGGAVVRNRCKRRLREIVRKYRSEQTNSVGFDLVINAKANLAAADFKQIEGAFARMMARFHESLLR